MNKDPSTLPGILGEIADLVGEEAAYKVLAEYGGTRIDIPAKASPDHWLSLLIGFEDAQILCRGLRTLGAEGFFHGVRHALVPLGPRSNEKIMRRRLANELRSGKDVRAAARAVGAHERTAWRMKKQLKNQLKDSDQGDLF